MKKTWYMIQLTDTHTGAQTIIARIKSKALAYIIKQQLQTDVYTPARGFTLDII